MKKATVLEPFITSRNETCLNGDVVFLERRFLGAIPFSEEQFGKYFKIEKLWE